MVLNSYLDYQRKITENRGKLLLYIFDKSAASHEHLSAVLKELEEDLPSIQFESIDHKLINEHTSIHSLPSFQAWQSETRVNTLDGCSIQMLVEFCKSWAQQSENESTVEKIQRLLDEHPVIVFIKGEKHDPFCKFSRAVVQMLNDVGVAFEAFNIFEDPNLREELKKYSKWPTYPQLYVNKVLVGGHDIIKELYEAGKLAQEFPEEALRK